MVTTTYYYVDADDEAVINPDPMDVLDAADLDAETRCPDCCYAGDAYFDENNSQIELDYRTWACRFTDENCTTFDFSYSEVKYTGTLDFENCSSGISSRWAGTTDQADDDGSGAPNCEEPTWESPPSSSSAMKIKYASGVWSYTFNASAPYTWYDVTEGEGWTITTDNGSNGIVANLTSACDSGGAGSSQYHRKISINVINNDGCEQDI
jgi:hypothetical protein